MQNCHFEPREPINRDADLINAKKQLNQKGEVLLEKHLLDSLETMLQHKKRVARNKSYHSSIINNEAV